MSLPLATHNCRNVSSTFVASCGVSALLAASATKSLPGRGPFDTGWRDGSPKGVAWGSTGYCTVRKVGSVFRRLVCSSLGLRANHESKPGRGKEHYSIH